MVTINVPACVRKRELVNVKNEKCHLLETDLFLEIGQITMKCVHHMVFKPGCKEVIL